MTKTIYYNGVKLNRNLSLENSIKEECKYYNSQRHPSERLNFKDYCECYYSYVTVKNYKVYTHY